MKIVVTAVLAVLLAACQHDAWKTAHSHAPTLPLETHAPQVCQAFLQDLDALSPKELKAENDRWQKIPLEKRIDDDVRPGLVAGYYQAKIKNYARAYEILSPISNRKNLETGCRLSIRLYVDLLSEMASLEREVAFERKQKGDLERKLKALSEIEKQMSARESKSQGL